MNSSTDFGPTLLKSYSNLTESLKKYSDEDSLAHFDALGCHSYKYDHFRNNPGSEKFEKKFFLQSFFEHLFKIKLKRRIAIPDCFCAYCLSQSPSKGHNIKYIKNWKNSGCKKFASNWIQVATLVDFAFIPISSC